MDKVTKEVRSSIMKSVKMKDSAMENDFRKKLWSKGIRFRKNNNKLYGKPDISISKYKIVIFLDSCFWHGCKRHYRKPTSNINYWNRKIAKNIERDEKVNKFYKENNWHIYRIWEHDLLKKSEEIIKRILALVK